MVVGNNMATGSGKEFPLVSLGCASKVVGGWLENLIIKVSPPLASSHEILFQLSNQDDLITCDYTLITHHDILITCNDTLVICDDTLQCINVSIHSIERNLHWGQHCISLS